MNRPIPSRHGAVAGLAAGALAITVGMFLSGLGETASPIDAVGSVVIDHVPASVKRLAIDWFGTNDKLALRVGIVTLLGLAAIAVGIAARTRRWIGVAGIGAFGLIGAWAAVTRPTASGWAALPSVLGAVAGAGALWFLLRPRPIETPGPSKAPLGWDRRRFLTSSAAVTAGAVVAGSAGVALERRRLDRIRQAIPDTLPPLDAAAPSGSTPTAEPVAGTAASSAAESTVPTPAGAELFGETPFITPRDRFYRIDTALSFPTVELSSWTMTIKGMVAKPLTLTYAQLLARPMVERTVTLTCVSNEVGGPYIGNAVWQGVLLRDLLAEAGVADGAEQVFSTSIDGWTCGFPVSVATDQHRDCLVAVGMNGKPLPLEHGFPARLVVPGLYGYVSATKWLDTIELNRFADAEGYWVPRGWARDAPIKTQSRIDVPRSDEAQSAGRVRIAGVAWAQHTGIAKVEVRVDGDEWHEATLAADVTDDSWRQWVYDWDATGKPPARYVAEVRATDKSGYTQTEERAEPAPDGATGYHSRGITIG